MRFRSNREVFRRLNRVLERQADEKANERFPPLLGAWSLYPMPDDEADRAEALFYTQDRTAEQEQELRALFDKWPDAEGKLREHMPTRKGTYMRFGCADWLC